MKQIWYRKTRMVLMASLLFLLASCIDGYHDDWTFSSGVTNTTLLSPDSSGILLTKKIDGDTLRLNVNWTVIYGAGGYKFSIYNVDDPTKPTLMNFKGGSAGAKSDTIDGCSKSCVIHDDSKYKIVIQSLGNSKSNNQSSIDSTVVYYTTLLPAKEKIPSGTDLYTYFNNISIPETTDEIAYELEANGEYTISGPIDFQKHWLTLRGDKINPPKVTFGAAGRIRTTAGLTLKYIDFDCISIPADATDGAMILLSSTPDPSILKTAYNNYYVIPKDLILKSCKISGINRRLIFDANIKYCLTNVLIDGCLVSLNALNDANGGIIYMQAGFINNFVISNSTVYGNTQTAGYFLRYNNSGRPDRAGFINGSISFKNNTFYNVVYSGQMGNYSGMNSLLVTLNLAKNIFVDCGSGQVVRRLSVSTTTMVRDLRDNCYWYNGTSPEAQEIIATYGDKSKSAYCADPLFLNASTGDFTIGAGATKVLTQKSGDPRWLPAQ